MEILKVRDSRFFNTSHCFDGEIDGVRCTNCAQLNFRISIGSSKYQTKKTTEGDLVTKFGIQFQTIQTKPENGIKHGSLKIHKDYDMENTSNHVKLNDIAIITLKTTIEWTTNADAGFSELVRFVSQAKFHRRNKF